jgi:hypothetical protein
MPARWLSLAIIAFWLGTNGWLFWRELWPRMLPDQPPPYTIDLVEEVQARPQEYPWIVEQDGRQVFKLRTRIERLGPDSFELLAYTNNADKTKFERALISWGVLRGMMSRYRVSAAGNFQALDVKVQGIGNTPLLHNLPFTTSIRGEAQGGKFAPKLQVEGGRINLTFTLPEVQVPSGGAVLLPLHPANRIRGLRPGQHWRVLLLDPLAESLGAFTHSTGEPRFLAAHVSAKLEHYTRDKRKPRPCLVIEYEGDRVGASTWVEQGTGLVLRQQANLDGTRWVLSRD